MAETDNFDVFNKAFSGLGVDEKSLISTLGKSHQEQRKSFRKGAPQYFIEDERLFEKWQAHHIKQLKHEFLRFKNAMVLWAMHPWERDARLVKEALLNGPQSYGVLIEVACARSSEELLGARKAYHSLYDHSIEEDVAVNVPGAERKLLVALVSSYRYEGPRVHEETPKSEAKILHDARQNAAKKNPFEDEEVVRILATRSKLHIKKVFNHYLEICGKGVDEDLDAELIIVETLQCLSAPEKYFSRVLDESLKSGADEKAKNALTRVIVTRADVDIPKIKEEYHNKYGVHVTDAIEEKVNGNYKDFLLTLLARGN